MKLDQLLLGQIPEAIYFALFMMLVKNIKEKRILFTILMILEYVFLKCFLVYNIWFQTMYFILSFIIMKMLYRDKTQVTDIFTLGIASIILVITSAIPYVIIYFTIHNMLIYVILNRIKNGVTICGIEGSVIQLVGETKSVIPGAEGQVITPSEGYNGLTEVSVSGDSNLIASNIKAGVTIFGVTGTYDGTEPEPEPEPSENNGNKEPAGGDNETENSGGVDLDNKTEE